MTTPKLAIIQARWNSTRLPVKMFLPIGGKPIIWHAWKAASQYFTTVVIATPEADYQAFCMAVPEAMVFRYVGDEADVLGRFYECARWFDATTIVRITPDDWPIDVTREVFTFAQLEHWHQTVTDPHLREHIGLLIPQRIEINTQEDYEAALKRWEAMQ